LASAPASCLHKLVLIDNLQDAFLHGVHNFSWSVSHCLRSVGYHLPTQVQSLPVIDVNTVTAGLEHQASLSWSNLSSNPRTAPTRNAKLCTWHNWFRPFNTSNPYFLLPVSGKRMKRFLRFRLSCHSLPVETGSHLFPDHLDFAHIVPYLALGMNIILSLSVQFYSHSETSITPFSIPKPLQCDPSLPRRIALKRFGNCLQVYFRLFRHDKRLVLMFFTRLLTTLAHLYNLVGWLKM